MMQSAKQLARVGIFYLEEAVLDVLFQATEENQLVIAAEIRRKIGLGEIDESDWVIRGILQKLFHSHGSRLFRSLNHLILTFTG